jgi:hypothetical protein
MAVQPAPIQLPPDARIYFPPGVYVVSATAASFATRFAKAS